MTQKSCAVGMRNAILRNYLKELKTIQHPLTGQEIKIIRRMCGDGKERRLSTDSSSTKSTYPIPEAPEHQSQLGDMKIICPEPVWTVSDAEHLPGKNLRLNCVEKPPPKKRVCQTKSRELWA